MLRKTHNFGGEKVHLAVDPLPGEPLPSYRCDRCERALPGDCFARLGWSRKLGQRVTRFRRVEILHPHCSKCRRQQTGRHASDPLYSPGLDSFFVELLHGTRAGAKKRGILVGIDKDDALGLFLEQHGVCAVSGIPMDWKARGYKAPSIDRIDSAGNYVIGNVQMVLQIVNIMKNDLPMDAFVRMCRQIADHNLSL